MKKKEELQRAVEMRSIAYLTLIDALTGLKHATRLIDERVTREGPAANFSMDSDLLDWAQAVWKASSRVYTLDQIIEDIKKTSKEKK